MGSVPEFIDPVFTKTSPKRSFSLNRKRAFWLVFVKTGSIISGTGFLVSKAYIMGGGFHTVLVQYLNYYNILSVQHMFAANRICISHNVVVMWPSGLLEYYFPSSLRLNAHSVMLALIWLANFSHYLQWYHIWFSLLILINIRFPVFAHRRDLIILIVFGQEKGN